MSGSAATRQEVKVRPAVRAVSPGGWGEEDGWLGRLGVCPMGLSLDAPVGTGFGRPVRHDLRRHVRPAQEIVKGEKSSNRLMSYGLDVSRVPRDLRSGRRSQVIVGRGRRDLISASCLFRRGPTE